MFVLCGLCLNVHDVNGLRHDDIHLCDDGMWCGPSVRGRIGSASHMHLQRGVRFNFNDHNCVCGEHGHVPDIGMWCGERMRGRVVAACRVYVQRWLRVHIDDDNYVCGHRKHLPCVWCRLQLRRQWRPSNYVLVLCWVCLNCPDVKRLHDGVIHVLDDKLRRRQCLCGWVCSACRVYMQHWICFHVDDIEWVHNNDWVLHDMHCGE